MTVPHTPILHALARYRPFAAVVVGDFMLDETLFGAAERLSPDAPVPILHAERVERTPGGAANVARCLRALSGDVSCVGVVGDDEAGAAIREQLEAEGCDCRGLRVDAGRPTTVKRSLVGLAQHRHPQKMFRIDIESRRPISAGVEASLLAAASAALDAAPGAVLCVEDYAKGVCTPALLQALIARCRETGTECLVDPAAIDEYARYARATAVTPNRSEAERATGRAVPSDPDAIRDSGLARALIDRLSLDAAVVTLDRHGALLQERDGAPVLVPTVARSVYDVTGAGDMVLAALAAARANGFAWRESVEFANAAAGLEVEIFGAQPIPFAQVHREIVRRCRGLSGKRRTLDELLVELAAHRAGGDRIVFTNGCFDVIHAGHVGYLREARALGDVLVVAVNGDSSVRALKGPMRPIYAIDDRLDILGELACVDYLLAFDEPTVHDLLRRIRPDVFVKGGDYEREQIAEIDVVRELGLDLRLLANRPGLGSTQVIERLRTAPMAD